MVNSLKIVVYLLVFVLLFMLQSCVQTGPGRSSKGLVQERYDERISTDLNLDEFDNSYIFTPQTEMILRRAESGRSNFQRYNLIVELPKDAGYSSGVIWVKYLHPDGGKVRLNKGWKDRSAVGKGVTGDYFVDSTSDDEKVFIEIIPLQEYSDYEAQEFEIAITDDVNRVVTFTRLIITSL